MDGKNEYNGNDIKAACCACGYEGEGFELQPDRYPDYHGIAHEVLECPECRAFMIAMD